MDSMSINLDPTAYDERSAYPSVSYDEIDTPPCEEYDCPNQAMCKAKRLACKGFIRYVNSGAVQQYATDMTNPTHSQYLKLFPEEV